MSQTIVVSEPDSKDLTLQELHDSARSYVEHSKSKATKKAYRSDWEDFATFCEKRNWSALPAQPETVAMYLAASADAGMKASTLSRRLAAISKRHSVAGYDSPTAMRHACVKETWSGIRRVKGVVQTAKAAATTDYLKRMLEQLPSNLAGKRDRALLLVGFAAALRRSELVGLDRADVKFDSDGIVITIRRSKTDQEGVGQKIGVPRGKNAETCPVRTLKAWLIESKITTGPIFRRIDRHGHVGKEALSDQVVALQVKRYAEAAGLDSSLFSGHSLRAGLATSAAQAGVSERRIQDQTRHRSLTMVRRYIRDGNLFRENAAGSVGL